MCVQNGHPKTKSCACFGTPDTQGEKKRNTSLEGSHEYFIGKVWVIHLGRL